LSDQHKLTFAPAVRTSQRPARHVAQNALPPAPAPQPAPAPPLAPPRPQNAHPERLNLPFPPANPRAGGKAVLGVPQHVAVDDDPHAMPPLPGQAPDKPIAIVFDGGSRGNPGEGYGSYQVRWPGAQPQVVRLRFGSHMTNNEAEYDTLISALEAVIKRLVDGGAQPNSARLDVYGDSLLVINQVMGAWKCKDARMEKRRDRVRALLKQFGDWTLAHHDRENSVRELGH
jgi:ribonuclease HI